MNHAEQIQQNHDCIIKTSLQKQQIKSSSADPCHLAQDLIE